MCPPAVQGMLKSVDGVEGCEIDFGKKTATVTVSKDVDPALLASAVTGRFTAKVAQ